MSDTIWTKLAATVPPEAVEWRQDGKVTQRDGRFIARFVAYINAQFVRERLDAVAPGEWNLTLDMLPPRISGDGVEDEACAFKATLTVAGATREDVGVGKDYKQASTDAFKRAGVRFGIGHELYTDYETIWVEMDGDGKFAKPTQEPATVWAKKAGLPAPTHDAPARPAAVSEGGIPAPRPAATIPAPLGDAPACPKCGGKTWDNRVGKKNPKAPDFKCRDKTCDGCIWPPRATKGVGTPATIREESDTEYVARVKSELDAEEIPF